MSFRLALLLTEAGLVIRSDPDLRFFSDPVRKARVVTTCNWLVINYVQIF